MVTTLVEDTHNMQSELLKRTLELVRGSDEPLLRQAEGAGVPYHWLYQVVNGRSKNPNVHYVEAVYVYHTKKPLLS